MKNICMLTTVHPPKDARIYHRETNSLLKKYNVNVISPDEKIINMYKTKGYTRLLSPFVMAKLLHKAYKTDADIYYCHEPGSLLLGVILKTLKNKKLVYDAHECYPSLISNNTIIPNPLRPLVYKIYDVSEKLLSKQADKIIVVSESVGKRLQYDEIIYNVPKEVNNCKCEKVKHSLVHVGNLSVERGLNQLLYSLKEIQKVYPDTNLTILGGIADGGNFADTYIKENNLNVNIIKWVEYDKIHEYLDSCQIGIILFQRGVYNTEIGLPNKLFEYMNSRCAVLASDFVEIRKVVNQSNCGVLVDPDNVKDITNSVIKLFENEDKMLKMGDRGHSAILNKYNWDNEEKKLLMLMSDIV